MNMQVSEPVPESAMSPAERRMAKARENMNKEVKADQKKIKVIPKKEKKVVVKSTKSTSKSLKSIPAASDGKVELKTICGQLNIDPKAARRVLRNSKLDFHSDRGRWAFTEKQSEKVKELLSRK